jgi:hypothetical protein
MAPAIVPASGWRFLISAGNTKFGGNIHKVSQGARLHLAHHPPAMRLDGDLTDAERAVDLLVQPASNDQGKNLTLTGT